MKNKILIISGDPNSINSEIIYKCWRGLSNARKENIYVISNYELIKQQLKILKYPIKISKVKNISKIKNNKLKIIDIDLKFKNPFNVPSKTSSNFIKKSLSLGHKLALETNCKGIINCPINKKLLKKKNQGVTELLAAKCKIRDNSEVMLIKSNNFSVAPITTHIKVKDIHKNIKKEIIIKKLITINNWFRKFYKKKPRIGILGLNPHNAELERNSEEKKIIIPSIKRLKKQGINVVGPLVADTVFINEFKKYDVIVGMYHDQVLTPLKSIFKFDAINITLGLKYIRLSPDHGVAKDILKKKIANHSSLLSCIKFLEKLK